MLLEVENRPIQQVDSFDVVETVLRDLRSYGSRSFAISTNSNGDFVQVAGGRVTCVLEHKTARDERPKRAFLTEKKVPFEGTQTLMFGGGHMQMEPDEILFIDDVVNTFRTFFNGQDVSKKLRWRSK